MGIAMQGTAAAGRAPTVVVYGASGHTGAFVVAELLRRGLTPVAAGRDAERLATRGFDPERVATRVADAADPAALDRAFSGAAAVLNCAGPFLDTAAPVAAAALRSGAHYLDVTAEQASATHLLDAFADDARRAGVAVVPAVSFYGGLADLLVTAVTAGWTDVEEVEVAIALDSWHPTPGTRLTGRRNTWPRLVVDSGRLVPLEQPAAQTTLTFASPFGVQPVTAVPFSEMPLIDRHLPVRRVRTWLTDTALTDLRDPSTPPPEAADASGRSAQQFLVEVTARGKAGGTGGAGHASTRHASARGRDIYAVTAPLVVEAVQRLLLDASRPAGTFAPGEVFDAADFLASLPAAALDVTLDATVTEAAE